MKKFCVYYRLLSGHETYIPRFAEDADDAKNSISMVDVWNENGNRITPEDVTAVHEIPPRSQHNGAQG